MIELPEARRMADQFLKTLIGKRVARVIPNASPHKFAWFHGDVSDYNILLSGRAVTGADAFGGIAEAQFGDMKLVFCDGANVRYYAAGEKLPAKYQLLLIFDDDSALVCSVQMYGAIWALDARGEEDYYQSSKQKIKPLDEAFDEEYFDRLRQSVKPALSVKAFLATEQRIPGLGNGVLQDILYNAGIHPRRKLHSLSDTQYEALHRGIVSTLRTMTEQGGRNTERDLFGKPGGYQTALCAKTLEYPCPRCGGGLVREAYLGGNIYFCPNCQPLER
ncbi:MAG: endonuclease VIII [Clostridiales bacterium]|jgi:formamidopyrimidine-DNA glycosylase|nr:endonuclease VIII [Clostridiales bacterium]